jgi:hypothetical protein
VGLEIHYEGAMPSAFADTREYETRFVECTGDPLMEDMACATGQSHVEQRTQVCVYVRVHAVCVYVRVHAVCVYVRVHAVCVYVRVQFL